jgi:DNA-binding transcriptional regulator LsrR (DeoR family)
MYNNDLEFEILKMFYNNYLNIDEIALKLGINEDEIDKIISFYHDKYFYDIPFQYIVISNE